MLFAAVHPQENALQLLPAIVFLCLSSPLESLQLSSPGAADTRAGDTEHRRTAISVAQLGPLQAMQHLPSLEISGLSSLGSLLASTLRHLTALTSLCLAADINDATGPCEVDAFDATAALTQLEDLCIYGSPHHWVRRLPDCMSRLTRLRQLEVVGVRLPTSHVLTTLTALQQLQLLDMTALPQYAPQLQNPVPPGMHALSNLRDLAVDCGDRPMPPLALPALTEPILQRPAFGGEVCPVLRYRPRLGCEAARQGRCWCRDRGQRTSVDLPLVRLEPFPADCSP